MKYVEREIKISFISKEESICPVCDAVFHREELLSGSGRLIAGSLTDELHRLYEPSVKYGDVYPLIYQATVCPLCWFASMDRDFIEFPKNLREKAENDRHQRRSDTELIFPGTSFHNNRDIVSGTASLYLLVRCYEFFPREFSPTIKQAIATLRASWMLEKMNEKFPGEHYDWLALLFKKKAQYFYNEAIRREQSGIETLSALKAFGPDIDKNYGYEGTLYLASLLTFKYAYHENPELRVPALEEAKRSIAKIFGVGKSSKAKPGPLLEHARSLYENISKELKEIDVF